MFTLLRGLGLGALVFVGCKSAPEAAPSPTAEPTHGRQAQAAGTTGSGPTVLGTAGRSVQVYDASTTAIAAAVGERFEVALPGNVTTPYEWSLDQAALTGVATLSAQSYTDAPPAECLGCVGYPGTAHFVLHAAEAGTAQLRFAYRKLGQTSGDARREVVMNLTVSP